MVEKLVNQCCAGKLKMILMPLGSASELGCLELFRTDTLGSLCQDLVEKLAILCLCGPSLCAVVFVLACSMTMAFSCLLVGTLSAMVLADCRGAACDSEETPLLQLHRESNGVGKEVQAHEWRRYGRWPRRKVVVVPAPPPAPCPYNFAPPACKDAEPQTPRDLSTGATGEKTPKAATLTDAQANFLPLTNVHFHLGAEHKSNSYKDDTHSQAYDAAPTDGPRPGFMCPSDTLTPENLTPYNFTYCEGVEVGKSYEVHYVHSSAGIFERDNETNPDVLADGLGGAANGRGQLNPMVA